MSNIGPRQTCLQPWAGGGGTSGVCNTWTDHSTEQDIKVMKHVDRSQHLGTHHGYATPELIKHSVAIWFMQQEVIMQQVVRSHHSTQHVGVYMCGLITALNRTSGLFNRCIDYT
jgi:hypothetical protein